MPRIYKRNCNICGKYYESAAKYYCGRKCLSVVLKERRLFLSDGSWYPKIPSICECPDLNCNETVYDGNEYVSGHQNRGKININHLNMFIENNPFFNHKHTEESKQKQSISHTKTFLLRLDGTKEIYPKIPVICGCNKCNEICWNGADFIQGHHTKTIEFKIKKSKQMKEREPWNKGLKDYFGFLGLEHPLLGTHCSEERKEKIRKGNKGKIISENQKQKTSKRMKENNPMKRFDVRIKITGKNNSQYIDGRSKFPYCFKWTKELRESVRIRDGYICQLCNKTQVEEGKRLSVHHIHYDKENCYPDLITLCRSCNCKVNKKNERKNYEFLFMNKLNDSGLLFWNRR